MTETKGPVNCTDHELSTFLQELAEGYLPTCSSDTSPSAPSRTMSIASKSWRKGKKTGAFPGSQYSLTFAPSTDDPGAASSTSSPEDSPAKTSPPQAKAQESPAPDPASGPKWRELSVKYDRATSSWRTAQCLFIEDLPPSSVTLPRSGMMLDGQCWEQTTAARPTTGNASGFWPTPRAEDSEQTGGHRGKPDTLTSAVRFWPTPTSACATGGQTSRSGKRKGEKLLSGAVKDPAYWPTPKGRDWKGQSQRGIHAPQDALPNLDRGDGKPIGGALNPPWVEWLMGFPIGWTDLEPLETPRFLSWLQLHSRS